MSRSPEGRQSWDSRSQYESQGSRYDSHQSRGYDKPSTGYGDRRSNYDRSSQDKVERESEDTIFIENLPDDVTEDKLAAHFGSIGVIKTDRKTRGPKIWIYKDKQTDVPKGDATLTYDDPPTADAAIEWFGGKEFMGNIIKVSKAKVKMPVGGRFGQRGGGGAGGGGYRDGGSRDGGFRDGGSRDGGFRERGGGGPQDGDWACESCGANNFARRNECFKCQATRPGSSGGGDRGRGSDRGRGGDYRGRGRPDRGNDGHSRYSGGGGREESSYRRERSERRDRPY